MKTLYLDIFSGISGDMFLAALVDLGVDFEQLEKRLARLGLENYHLHLRQRTVNGIRGCKFEVHLAPDHAHEHTHGHGHHHHEEEPPHHHHHEDHEHGPDRTFADIKALIEKSKLSAWVKERAIAVFRRIAVAEGKVHGRKPDQVHFHEVGAVDSIIDIVGACLALEMLGKPRVLAAPVTEGRGWVECAHGRFPVPAPATLAILAQRGIALTQCEEPQEMVTPTGAALLAEFAEDFGPLPRLTVEKIGYGLGTRQLQTRPNCLRAILGTADRAAKSPSGNNSNLDWETDQVAVLETNLDDINAEILGHFMEKALGLGALDVFFTPVTMKKNRPGVVLTVLCPEADAERFAELILRETTAFGVRCQVASRRKLPREFARVKTGHGEVIVKLGKLGGKVIQAAPEYESCKTVATKAGLPVKAVYEAALQALTARKKT